MNKKTLRESGVFFDFSFILCYNLTMKTLEKKSLFWDVKSIDPEKNQRFVIERILDFGDEIDFKWAIKYYGKDKIVENLTQARTLSAKSLLFWCQYFNINKEKCLANQSIQKQSAFWKR